MFSIAVFHRSRHELVGFAIGRLQIISDLDMIERHRLGILEPIWNSLHIAYVLTLGVVKKFQRQGLGAKVVSQFEEAAKSLGAQLVYLHAITYNEVALNLYKKTDYNCVTLIHNFYHIRSGRQLEPERFKWDAFILVKRFISDPELEALQRSRSSLTACLGLNLCWPFAVK